ncbi:DinB family protein [Longispora sp. K20-0274]|uniref:DinB family protein n=1 Tax=Longispora sp. K20-0274 TaxID=3088255 RepID=UPI00399A8DBB
MTWTAPDIERGPRTDMAGGEREMLDDWLRLRRVFLLRKCAGLTAEQLKTPTVEPSGLTLLGLLRHMTEVERWWFREKYLHEELPELYLSEEYPDGDFDLVADADAEADYARFLAETAACDAAVAGIDLDAAVDDEKAPTGKLNLRWVYIHLIEEYAQHTGHADMIRERLDGMTGA